MSALPRIAVACEGDAESPDRAWSGIVFSVVRELRAIGHRVTAIDAELYGARRVLLAARAFSPVATRRRARYRFGRAAFEARSRVAEAGFRAIQRDVDVILQIGATFRTPGRGSHPHVVYCDWNMASTINLRDHPHSAARSIPPHLAAEMNDRERTIYTTASAIFTLSDRLRASFTADYGVPAERVVTAHPGPNLDVSSVTSRPPRRDADPPTILFMGKDFERKGGDVLLQAFELVRARVPDARLRIIGPPALPSAPKGVEMMGTLRKAVPQEFAALLDALRTTDVFCLPTHYEPFGIVVIEAMALGVPCVTSDTWAMPEMVIDDETGLIAPDGDARALADRLVRLLEDPVLARRMGLAGQHRQQALFTWQRAAQVMSRRIQSVVG